MKYRSAVLIAAVVLSFTSSEVKTCPEDPVQNLPYQYDVRVEMVGLFATVLDHAGKLVTDLGRNDFLLYEDGKPQVISQFSREYIPLSILFLLDTSGSMDGEKLYNARKSIIQFIKHLNRDDEAMLMEFRAKPRVIRPFTRDFGKIEGDLNRLEGTGSTALYDAILSALDQMRSAKNRRRAVLLISDGINTYGKARLEDSIAGLKRHGIELFTIGIETDIPHELAEAMEDILNRLTQSAGGEAFIVNDARDLRRICAIISDQMHHQYSFGYYPPSTAQGEWRAIKLETKTRGLRVLASRTGYFAAGKN